MKTYLIQIGSETQTIQADGFTLETSDDFVCVEFYKIIDGVILRFLRGRIYRDSVIIKTVNDGKI